ncbi:MAG: helix-turn-helix transcriptional regulator [Armatimonadota bacterium]
MLIEQVGQRIKRRRLARGLTQRELAARVGVRPAVISLLECGKFPALPRERELLKKLARALRCRMTLLFDPEVDTHGLLWASPRACWQLTSKKPDLVCQQDGRSYYYCRRIRVAAARLLDREPDDFSSLYIVYLLTQAGAIPPVSLWYVPAPMVPLETERLQRVALWLGGILEDASAGN